jgi:hypothetical protein
MAGRRQTCADLHTHSLTDCWLPGAAGAARVDPALVQEAVVDIRKVAAIRSAPLIRMDTTPQRLVECRAVEALVNLVVGHLVTAVGPVARTQLAAGMAGMAVVEVT